MRLSTILAGTFIAGTAMLGLAAPAFAGTPTGGPTPSVTVTPNIQHTYGPNGNDNNGGDKNGKGGDNKGDKGKGDNNCRGNQWNSQDNQWSRNCDPQPPKVNDCREGRDLLPWQCTDNNCHYPLVTTTAWNDQGPWVFENSSKCDPKSHKPTCRCTSQLIVFNFPHNSSTLTETQGPWLSVNEVATYQGKSYTITSVHHTLLGHDTFTVRDSYGHAVTNHGPSIWHGDAHTVCTVRR